MDLLGRKWRKLMKKMQRKKRRQKKAKKRDEEEHSESMSKLNDPEYQEWLTKQAEWEEFENFAEQRARNEAEEIWLRRELLAQKEFHLKEEHRRATEAAKEALCEQQAKELAEIKAARIKEREKQKHLAEKAAAEFENVIQKMEMYLNGNDEQTPEELKRDVETRPGEKQCEFYERTNCCRFGITCVFNHKRPLLSKIILINHFFTHALLETVEHPEYASADSHLELNENDLLADYKAFFNDVCPELESFGKIRNLRTVRNVLPHLRGNLFVEYENKRSALNAFTKLQGRYYASKRLNVEFSNLKTWRGAVCGLSISRKCLRGNKCGYLHILRNPGNKYNSHLENTKSTTQVPSNGSTPLLSWDEVCEASPNDSRRNWRWSESPEHDILLNQKTMPTEDDKQGIHSQKYIVKSEKNRQRENVDKRESKSSKSDRKRKHKSKSSKRSNQNDDDIKHVDKVPKKKSKRSKS